MAQMISLEQIPYLKDHLSLHEEAELVSLQIVNDHFLQRLFRRLGFKIPQVTQVELDKYAAAVLKQIDGQSSVAQIGENLEKLYGQEVEPVNERLIVFLTFLSQQKKWLSYQK